MQDIQDNELNSLLIEEKTGIRKYIPFCLMLFSYCGRIGDIFLHSPLWGWSLRSLLSLYQTFKTRYIIIICKLVSLKEE